MKIVTSSRFDRCIAVAPPETRKAFDKQSKLLLENLRHPSLRAKKYDEATDLWQARVTGNWRFFFNSRRHLFFNLHRSASEIVLNFMPKIERIKDGKGICMPLRITRRARQKLKSPRFLVRCGCCDGSLEIYYDDRPSVNRHSDSLEINGVNGTVDQWRKVLLPLLKVNR